MTDGDTATADPGRSVVRGTSTGWLNRLDRYAGHIGGGQLLRAGRVPPSDRDHALTVFGADA